MDEEHEQRKYSRMEKETLVEEILHMKRFLIKFENLSLEGKAHAQRVNISIVYYYTTLCDIHMRTVFSLYIFTVYIYCICLLYMFITKL